MKKINLIDKKFGRLQVIEEAKKRGNKRMWKCRCDCGNITIVATNTLKSGHTTSCGCLRTEKRPEFHKVHGMTKTRLYKIWVNMKQRCYIEENEQYPNYGGRGIEVCEEWRNDFQSFYNWAIANGYQDDLSIDRKNPDGHYEPSNCRWATMKEQQNNRRNNHLITYNGETHTMMEWSEITGTNYKTIANRLYKGKSVEQALFGK
ncbi:MAG: hypothetical protein J6B26_06295 [Agathobacter sp.]|nr:hypothetical protein [Agathobacter sp.]